MSRSIFRLLTLGMTVLAAACATTPTGRLQLRLVSDKEMAQMGTQAFTQLKEKVPATKDARTSSYVDCVAHAITAVVAPGQQWEVRVFESKEVNAFALPGGKIGVYTGLLKVADNQDQLAAVIGHETAHVIAGHSAARVSNQLAEQLGVGVLSVSTGVDPQLIGAGANMLLLLPYSRGDESEADQLGMDYMAQAGFDPRQAIELWHNMEKQGGGQPPAFLSDHPSSATRIRDLEKHLPQALPLYEQARAAGKRPRCQ